MKKAMQASEIMFEQFVRGDPEAEARVEDERKKVRLIAKLRDLREQAGLSHADLARKMGTKAAAIAELEDPDNDGHSLEDLQRLVSALGMELELKLVKNSEPKRQTKTKGAA